jgi:hypothetical protein
MANKHRGATAARSRPGNPEVRTGEQVGPDYPDIKRTQPWGTDHTVGDHEDKAIYSGNGSLFDPDEMGPIHKESYDNLWEGD